MKIKKSLSFVVALLLSACSVTPSREPELQSAAPVEKAQTQQIETVPGNADRPGNSSQSGGYLAGDGPGSELPANLDAIPDAVPRNEALHRYANRPYSVLGHNYTPQTAPGHYKKRGIASWYGKKFHGQPTSSGETYDMFGMTAAHTTLPIPSYARVTNLRNHKSVIVRINDRGPFLHERIIDLSYTAAHKLGIIKNGSTEVEVESIAPNSALASAVAARNSVAQAPLAPTNVGNYFLQLGAFRSPQGAENFLSKMRAELSESNKQIELYQKNNLLRIHVGPYASKDEARASAKKLQAQLGFKPVIYEH